MPVTLDLVGFLVMGLLGGVGHCVGMCGPFVLFLSRVGAGGDVGTEFPWPRQLAYNAGRVATYVVLGAMAGLVGQGVDLAGQAGGFQDVASVVAGLALVLYAGAALAGLSAGAGLVGRLSARVVGVLGKRPPRSTFLFGMLLGLLPCGLLYAALVAATAQGGPVRGAVALALFGAGTVPALLALASADTFLSRWRSVVNHVGLAFVGVMGVVLTARGVASLLAS
jgi:hypothetical protein